VFKFIIDYKRIGYSYLDVSTKIPLRPYNHDEYARFLPTAYPYYVAVFTVLFGFVVFTVVFLYGRNKE
jgi:oligosaccharyltransferase complex subunit beta